MCAYTFYNYIKKLELYKLLEKDNKLLISILSW